MSQVTQPLIGIVGGGQLAKMIALAGLPMGFKFAFLDPAKDACAAPLGTHICRDYDDREGLTALASISNVITYEFENIPASAIEFLSKKLSVYPGFNALSLSRDRLHEKNLFKTLGIPVAPFMQVDTREEFEAATRVIGLPAILKTRTLGYDGKGQIIIREQRDIEMAWTTLGGVPLILESFVLFRREVSIIAVRGRHGETAFYPLAENVHRNGILQSSVNIEDEQLQAQAEKYAGNLLQHFGYVGVMTLELFDTGSALIANEMAPRVHNSGHWTIEGALTSQFENHLRAILELPLGSTQSIGYSAMVNFIGNMPPADRVLSIPGVTLHDYGKASRAGRKVGHATLHAHNKNTLLQYLPGLLDLSR